MYMIRDDVSGVTSDGVSLYYNPDDILAMSPEKRVQAVRNVIIRLLETALRDECRGPWSEEHQTLRDKWTDDQWNDIAFKYDCAIKGMRIARYQEELSHIGPLEYIPSAKYD